MFRFTTGDILKSDAYALINTVNCEGFMGKGLAYQFKLRYPEMNNEYIRKCKAHELTPGTLHCYKTDDKLIINFPTKDKWREKSKISFITSGLDALIKAINDYHIDSIAVPPLGSGNGGLNWSEVREIIIEKLSAVSEHTDIIIYEPALSGTASSKKEPQLSLSALILMLIKFKLEKSHFNKIGLQKTVYFMNILSGTNLFSFKKAPYGPFDSSISRVSDEIKDFQQYYNGINTREAYDLLMQKLISKKVKDQLDFYEPFINKAASFTNHFSSTKEVEGAGTALFIIQNHPGISENEIINEFQNWSKDKAARFSEDSIIHAVNELENYGFIENSLCGYQIAR